MTQDYLASREPITKPQLLSELLASIGLAHRGVDPLITGISDDSRHVDAGYLFMARAGLRIQGQQYIEEAIAKGALAVLYAPPLADDLVKKYAQVVFVELEDIAEKIGLIAAKFFGDASAQLQVIGVTGTNGKTSCTHYIAQSLNVLGTRCAVIGTLGNGVPPHLTLSTHTTPSPISLQKTLALLFQQGVKAVALEVSSHGLALHRVVGVKFALAVFTQLSQDHLDFHQDMQTYAQTKAKLFSMPGLKFAVLNADDSFGRELIAQHHNDLSVCSYSLRDASKATVTASAIESLDLGYKVAVHTKWGDGVFSTQLLAKYNISNLLVVLSSLCCLGYAFNKVLATLSQLQHANGRMHLYTATDKARVIVDYAHTPDALQKTLLALKAMQPNKIWCVFGCGGDRDQKKRARMGAIAECFSDHVILTNDNPRSENPQTIVEHILSGIQQPHKVIIELDRAQAIAYAITQAQQDDVILIAGKGHESYQLINGRRLFLNDGEQVTLALKCA